MDFTRPVESLLPGTIGRVLAVLAETTAELNLRTIARLADVSPAQASRVLPALVQLGLVDRREVPPSSLFRLVPEHVAAKVILSLAGSADAVLNEMGRLAEALPVDPASVVVFGSFARREAGAHSDIDVLVVRPDHIDEDDESWASSIEGWRTAVQRAAGNPVELLEVGHEEAIARMASQSELWAGIRRDGMLIHGVGLHQLIASQSA